MWHGEQESCPRPLLRRDFEQVLHLQLLSTINVLLHGHLCRKEMPSIKDNFIVLLCSIHCKVVTKAGMVPAKDTLSQAHLCKVQQPQDESLLFVGCQTSDEIRPFTRKQSKYSIKQVDLRNASSVYTLLRLELHSYLQSQHKTWH